MNLLVVHSLCASLLSVLASGSDEHSAVPPPAREETVRVFVEFDAPCGAVALHSAKIARRAFDASEHELRVRAAQDEFLRALDADGIAFQVTETPLQLATGAWNRPNRFTFLINGVELVLPLSKLPELRAREGVKRVTPEEHLHLALDNSVRYVRGNDGPGNKTIFSRNGGPLTRYDGTGQVIAIIDTGIEHTHPAFDTRFTDAQFAMRTGDVRPVRTAGQPYVEGVHHPKVVYYLALTATTNEDDVGHGTHCATDSAGLKVQGPGLDRIPGNADDKVIEGVAPGALLMGYKLCETSFTCAGTAAALVTALEDALSPTDPAGNPKPIATVVNMSFGGAGDADSPSAVAASNAALLGAVMVASAGNEGPSERTLGAPGAGRRVVAVAACKDPGAYNNEVDVLTVDPLRYGVASSTGAQNDTGRPVAPQDIQINAIIMAGSPDVTFGLGQHYVYCGLADTPEQVPDAVSGRIALIARGSQVDLGVTGSGAFANKVAQVTAKGAVAALIFNDVDGELEATTAAAAVIPVYGLSKANGEYLRDSLGFQNPAFDAGNSLTWATISDFPVRIDPADPATFAPNTTGFSSRGPIAEDRYVKPDVTAPGENIYGGTIAAGGASTGGGTMSDPARFISVSGTSFSSPTTAGAAALLRQAMLAARGESPVPGLDLRSGAGAAEQAEQNAIVPMTAVRAALQNTATNLRATDGETPLANSDARSFIHAIGSGLIHVVQAVDARAYLGTNDQNGLGGPDDALDPDFLPTHSFGENQVISTGLQNQTRSVTVTLESAGAGGAGTYSLSLVDGGALRGDVTRPVVGTTGFHVALSPTSVALTNTPGNRATFDVTVTVDGRNAPLGLAVGGTDVAGMPATEFLWWVVATGTNGEVLRMPFSYRALVQLPEPARKQPFLAALAPSGGAHFQLTWTYPADPAEQPCGFVIERARRLEPLFGDDAEDALVLGDNAAWTGDDTWTTVVHPDTLTNGYSPVYTDSQDVRLTSAAPIPLPSGRALLSFASHEDIEDGFDYAYVEVSGDGGPFLPMAVYTGNFAGRRNVDLSFFAGQDVLIRFRFVTDELMSAPLFLGWFLDDIAIDSADFHALGTVDGSTLSFDVAVGKALSVEESSVFYRVGGLFDSPCDENGPYSNVRELAIGSRVKPPVR